MTVTPVLHKRSDRMRSYEDNWREVGEAVSRWRWMREVEPGHWMVGCRACGRLSRKHFDTALGCHDYWREHELMKDHAKNADPNHWSAGDAHGALLREILGG
jgi:hypothetical protein